jgi:hypothetical protein
MPRLSLKPMFITAASTAAIAFAPAAHAGT